MAHIIKKARTAAPPCIITFGEALVRFQPIDEAPPTTTSRHQPQPFLRSLGGDELNVAVAVACVGVKAKWISVLPAGPMGQVVRDACTEHSVEFAGKLVEGGDLGIFTVLPEQQTVHYQRRHSAFALHEPGSLDWPSLLHVDGAAPWLHVTGITPLVSAPARQSWDGALHAAARAGLPASLDLNWRPQLGTLGELWCARRLRARRLTAPRSPLTACPLCPLGPVPPRRRAMVTPHLPRLELLILSLDQLKGLVGLAVCPGLAPFATVLSDATPSDAVSDAPCLGAMEVLQARRRRPHHDPRSRSCPRHRHHHLPTATSPPPGPAPQL